jgi:hypothetical protein
MAAQLIATKLRSARGLAGAALAGDEHRGVVAGHSARQLEEIAHRAALADHEVLHHAGPEAGPQGLDLAPQLFPLLGLPQGHHHFVGLERLVEIVVRPFAHGGQGAVLGAVPAHHDEQRRAALAAIAPEERDAVHLRHPDVAEDQVERFASGPPQGGVRVGLDGRLVPRLLEQERERLAESGIVVNDQHTHRRHSREAGRL